MKDVIRFGVTPLRDRVNNENEEMTRVTIKSSNETATPHEKRERVTS